MKNVLKKHINSSHPFKIKGLLEKWDKVDLSKYKYEGVFVMVDYYEEKLKINENQFLTNFNKVLSDLLSYYDNKDAIISQMPSQFVFNDSFKDKFISLLPISKEENIEIIKKWDKEAKARTNVRTIKELYAVGFPYLYLAYTVKNEDLRNNIFMMVNMLMYSMAYAQIFPNFNYIEDKGQYVIQNVLVNKGFAKYESIYELFTKFAEDTYNTFTKRPLTDRVLYETLYSNIQAKIKYYMKQFYQAYISVGNKYLTTNKDIITTKDRDGEVANIETNIESNSAVILGIVKNVSNYVTNPAYIEDRLLREMLVTILKVNPVNTRTNIDKRGLVERNIMKMIESVQKTREFEEVISNILYNFLWNDEKNPMTVNQIETSNFSMKATYDLSYIKNNIYINKIIDILDVHIGEVLSDRGKDITTIDNKTKQRYRKALIYYFSILIQLVMKRQ